MDAFERLDGATDADARALLTLCCGSTRWVTRMLTRRPFGSEAALLTAARQEWFALTPDDWREAFAHHPKIGERASPGERLRRTAHLSTAEQRAVGAASDATLAALAAGNRAYEDKFGYIFIVCATGKSADEMLTLLRSRLHNDADTELRIAAEEQARITELRLRHV